MDLTDANGCSVTDSINVGLTIGLNDITKGLIVGLYPNPAKSNLTVELSLTYDFIFVAYDVRGKQVLKQDMVGGKNSVSLANLSTGLYVYHIFNTSGVALSRGKFNVLK